MFTCSDDSLYQLYLTDFTGPLELKSPGNVTSHLLAPEHYLELSQHGEIWEKVCCFIRSARLDGPTCLLLWAELHRAGFHPWSCANFKIFLIFPNRFSWFLIFRHWNSRKTFKFQTFFDFLMPKSQKPRKVSWLFQRQGKYLSSGMPLSVIQYLAINKE